MKLTMILCDHAAVAEGKLYIAGGGWTLAGPDPSPSAIALVLEVPWTRANQPIRLDLALLHEDGEPVTQQAPAGQQPVGVSVDLEVGRPPGTRHGVPLPVPLALNFPPFLLQPDQGFTWKAIINGEESDDWRLSFRTRALPVPSTDPTALPPGL